MHFLHQDMIAIPDFSAGAMENWGLITYRESALLYSPAFSSVFSKTYVASVISHELAHQWFGNLVRKFKIFTTCNIYAQKLLRLRAFLAEVWV